MDGFLRWMHKAMVIRRLTWGWAIWMSTWITIEVWEWVKQLDKLDATTGIIIGAILTPVLGLTGYIIKQHAVNPTHQDKNPNE